MTDSHDTQSEPETWLVVYMTYNPAEAHVIAGRLESEGFHPWVHQEPGGSALGITVGILGEIRVLVAESEYEAARHLLGEGVDDEDDEEYDEDDLFDLDDDDFE